MLNGPTSTIEQDLDLLPSSKRFNLIQYLRAIAQRMGPDQSGKLNVLFTVNALLLTILVLKPASPRVTTAIDDVTCVLCPLLAAIWCFTHFMTVPAETPVFKRSWLSRHSSLSTLFFGAGMLAFSA